ncbi:MAG: bifunctional DNA-binding transcriptional regulator/O6-methylguanine-DNA methyltransferase Ada [Gemmatimonadaceae bacterium]
MTVRDEHDDDTRWSAVQARDPAADGLFAYAVRSTGIYCRPSCYARMPLRRNVLYFDTTVAAEDAGFRACRRCRPAERPGDNPVERARAYLEARVDRTVTLSTLALAVGQSPTHLQRAFKRAYGISPRQYVAALRSERMKRELRGGATVSRAAFEAGYGASSRLYESASSELGMSPATYRRGGRGIRLRYVITGSPVGMLLVAATRLGVSAVTLADDETRLVEELAAEYPLAERVRQSLDTLADDDPLRGWAESIVRHLEQGAAIGGVPLDVAGTPFQRRVWDELRTIPAGETRSYSRVAEAIGRPRAVCAVASACASNRVALVIPCHRVVRGDGALGGYRWGVQRKHELLGREYGIVARRV